MKIAIDVRPLQGSIQTGVGEYAYELLSAVFSLYPEHEYYLCSSGIKPWKIPVAWQRSNIIPLHLRIPNKLINVAIVFFAYPRLSQWPQLLGKKIMFDRIYFPNLNFIVPEPKIKTILTVHDLTFTLFSKFFSFHRRLWHVAVKPKKLITSMTHLAVPSEATLRDVRGVYGVAADKISVVYPGLCSAWSTPTAAELRQVKQKYCLPDNFILCLGTIEPRKNNVGAIEAFALWQKKYQTSASLIIAGAPGWKNKKIYKLIKKTPGVRVIGYVPERDKPALYQLARVFLYPSFYEGFGLPVLEALRSGVPVIASQRAAMPEVVGQAAFLVDPNRTSDLVAGLELLWSNKKTRTEYVQLGYEQIKKFSISRSAQQFMNLLV